MSEVYVVLAIIASIVFSVFGLEFKKRWAHRQSDRARERAATADREAAEPVPVVTPETRSAEAIAGLERRSAREAEDISKTWVKTRKEAQNATVEEALSVADKEGW